MKKNMRYFGLYVACAAGSTLPVTLFANQTPQPTVPVSFPSTFPVGQFSLAIDPKPVDIKFSPEPLTVNQIPPVYFELKIVPTAPLELAIVPHTLRLGTSMALLLSGAIATFYCLYNEKYYIAAGTAAITAACLGLLKYEII
jgi:hypothetical protein